MEESDDECLKRGMAADWSAAAETNVVEQTIERERRYGRRKDISLRLKGLRRSLCVTMRGVGGEESYGSSIDRVFVFPPNGEVVLL